MERRKKIRRPLRIPVRFWEHGSEKKAMGYTANISTSGMYITANRVLQKGVRLRAELSSSHGASVTVEAVVARVDRAFKAMLPDGMGVRFLTMEELVGELVPELGAATQGPAEQPSADDESVYKIHFANHQQFLAAYERDLSTGGLFVPSQQPAPLNEIITVQLSVGQSTTSPVRFQARVVHRIEPGNGNLMAGMGVELLNFEHTLQGLQVLANGLRQQAAQG